MSRFSQFGFNKFSWSELKFFESKTGIVFDHWEAGLLKQCCDTMQSGLHTHNDDEAEPPYMSADFKKKRQKALEQVAKFRDDVR